MKKKRRAEVPNEQTYEEIQLKGYYRNEAFEADEDDVDAFRSVNCPNRTDTNDRRSPNNSSNILSNNLSNILSNTFTNNLPSISSRLTESVPRLNYSSTRNSSAIGDVIINLKNVYFKYSQKQDWLLNGLQLSVPTGRIYSLLGAAESGKTTIVKLILGLLRPTSGCVHVLDHQVIGQMTYGLDYGRPKPNDDGLPKRSIGYLPADDYLVLYERFSVQELLTFYGRLYLMSRDEIELRIKQLTCLLQIRCANQKIGELTKSERRLIGLASSIIHNPSLIVLDQPTAGLCPEASRLVWELLSKQTASSILVTSAHFEEVRQFSDQVGFLRKGKLLAEKSTDALLTGYRLNSLEQVYLKLCKLEKLKAKSTADPVFLQIKQTVDKRIEDNFNSSINQASSCDALPSSSYALPSSSRTLPTSSVHFTENSSISRHSLNPPKTVNAFSSFTSSPATLPSASFSSPAPFTSSACSSVFRGSSINQTNKQLDSLRPNRAWLLVFLSLLHANLKRSIRSPGRLLVQFLLPACQLICFYFAFGRNPHGIPVGIINDDRSVGSLLLPPANNTSRPLSNDTYLNISQLPASNLSRLFINHLDSHFINSIDYAKLEDAIRDVKRNRLSAIVHIGSQFSALLGDRLQLNDNLTRKQIEKSSIFVHADQTNRFLADFVQRSLIGSFYQFIRQLTADDDGGLTTNFNRRVFHLNETRKITEDVYYLNSGRDAYHFASDRLTVPQKQFKNFAYLPFDFGAPIFGKPIAHPEHKAWRDFTVPRLLVNIVFTISFGLNCVQFMCERTKSHFERQHMAACSPVQIVLAYSLTQLIFSLFQIALLLILSVELFNLTLVGPYSLIVVLLLLVATSGLLFGIFLSFHFRRPSTVILISGLAHFYLLIVSACLWPIEAYPKWTRYLVALQPTNQPSQTLENLFFRSPAIGQSGFLISLVYTAAFGYLSVRRFCFLSVNYQ